MSKHEIYISRNKVSLYGIWAWLFIARLILWFITGVLNIIMLFI